MIGDPTRVGDLAVTINCDPMSGWFVHVVGVNGDKRNAKHASRAIHPITGRVYEKGFVIWDIPDACLQPIRPSAPEEQVERAEHLTGCI